jgi:hypothetical protein
MTKNPYWDGKVHKAVKFGDRFDSRTEREEKERHDVQPRPVGQRQRSKLYETSDPGRSGNGSSACSGADDSEVQF